MVKKKTAKVQELKTVRILVMFTEEQGRLIEETAEAIGLDRSSFIRSVVLEKIKISSTLASTKQAVELLKNELSGLISQG